MSRDRHEHQIREHQSSQNQFDKALLNVISRRSNWLDWFTDEQIAEIRAEMVRASWRSNRNAMASRKIHAASAQSMVEEIEEAA